MKIDSAAVNMESARTYQSTKTTSKSFKIVQYQAALANGNMLYADINNGNQETLKENKGTQEDADSSESKANMGAVEWQNRFGVSAAKLNIRSSKDTVISDIKQLTLRYIFNLLFLGRNKRRYMDDMDSRFETENPDEWTNRPTAGAQSYEQGLNILNLSGSAAVLRTAQMKALTYSAEYYESEKEETGFSTVGHVKTSDGRVIDFNINVGMSREFERYYGEEVQMTQFNLCDPLVINLDTDAAELEDQTFYFDIDADGEKDEISKLGAGSGYLALDKNGDGTINDGSELFGTASGDGFRDLAKYDDDGNGWIDENDEIWAKLKIWTKDGQGRDVLYSLSDKNVGAIYLGSASTDYTLKGDDGHTKGAIRSSGVFLYENGNVGTVQHVDVAKYAKLA